MKTHIAYLSIIAVAIFVFCLQQCNNQKKTDALVRATTSYSDSARTYKDKLGNQIAYNSTLEFQNQKQLKDFLSKNDSMALLLKKFKHIISVTQSGSTIVIHDTVPIYFDRPIPCDFKPFAVHKDTIFYHFKGTIYPDRFTLDSINIPNKQTIVVGEKKTGFLKREQQINIMNSNPYVIVTNAGAYTINTKKKWYQTALFQIGVGLAIGYGVANIQQGISR